MLTYITINKMIGETPLMALTTWRRAHPRYASVPAAYAGRLDPMASGTLLILLGEECKRQQHYTHLDKAYEIEVLLDVGSDTGDILGLTSYAARTTRPTVGAVSDALVREIGSHVRRYPAYSSKTVRGKPLFLHTLEGTLRTEDLPTHTERIYRIEHLNTTFVASHVLHDRIASLLDRSPRTSEPSKMRGADFRIDSVRSSWHDVFTECSHRDFAVLRLRVISGSGTYMRSLAGRIGETLGTRALALSITRTTIGRYIPFFRYGFWLRKYE